MGQSPLGKANSASARHEIARTLQNLKVIAVSRSVCPLLLLLNNMTSVHTLPSYLSCILILSFHLCLGLPKCSVQVSPPNPCACVASPTHLIILDITWIIFDKEYTSWTMLIMQFSPVSCHFLRLMPKHFPQHLFSSNFSPCCSLWKTLQLKLYVTMCVVTTIHSPSPEAISDTAGSTVT